MTNFGKIFVLPVLLLTNSAAFSQNNTLYDWRNIAGLPAGSGSADGTNSAALFYRPAGVAADNASNVFVADQWNSTIRKLTPVGTNWVATTLAGSAGIIGSADDTNSAALFDQPFGVAVDNAGNVFVADQWNSTIRKLTPVGTNWVVTTLAGVAGTPGTADGTNRAARFDLPTGIAVDNGGNVFVADQWNQTIRKLTPVGTNWVVTTVAGLAPIQGSADGTNSTARFNLPTGVTVNSAGNLFVSDSNNSKIRKLTQVGTNWVVTTVAGSAGNYGSADGTNHTAQFNNPSGIVVDSAGNLFVTDQNNSTIRKITPVGTNWVVTTIGGTAGITGTNDGIGNVAQFNSPSSVAMDIAGNLFVADRSNNRITQGIRTLPALASALLSSNLVISWPSVFAGFAVQTNANLANTTGWKTAAFPINDDGTNKSITVHSPMNNIFFRLRLN